MPSELCGRSVLYSMRQASMTLRARDAQEPVFVETFVAELALKLSMYAFSFGLPGRIKERRTPVRYDHLSST